MFISFQAFGNQDRLLGHCLKPTQSEPYLTYSDFSFSELLDISKMTDKFKRLYEGEKRLWRRFYYDPEQKVILTPGYKRSVVVPNDFINSVKNHIEMALKRKYANFAFFPDMGHSHFFIPQKQWQDVYNKIPVGDRDTYTETFMSDKQLRILYHTAEQLKLIDEEKNVLPEKFLQWRYYSRNIIGFNRGLADLMEVLLNPNLAGYNTVREYEDYKYWGAGFYLHANKNGCFEYKTADGETQYFDLSYESFPQD